MEKDPYAILGIKRSEDSRGVQDAYRRLAKRYHPDCAGEGGTAKFREIQEAYDILSDAQKRLSYDVKLAHREQSDGFIGDKRPHHGRTSRPHPWAPEPLVPTAQAEPLTGHERPPPWSFFARTTNSAEMEIVLRWQDAARGGTMRLPVSTMRRCPACSAMQSAPMVLRCSVCGGTGTIEDQIECAITLPSGIRDGMVVEIPGITMSHIATRPMRVRVRIEP